MRIINKLIPIITISSVVSSLTTSCSNTQREKIDYQSISCQALFDFDTPIRRHNNVFPGTIFENKDDVINLYWTEAKNDHLTYTDDILISAQKMLQYWLEVERRDADWYLSNFIGTVKIGIADVNVEERRLTYGIQIESDVLATYKEFPYPEVKLNLKANILAQDIKFDLDYLKTAENENVWWAHAAYVASWVDPTIKPVQNINVNELNKDKKWSISLNADINTVDSSLPDIQSHVNIASEYDYESTHNADSLVWLSLLFSDLWHEVDFLSQVSLI